MNRTKRLTALVLLAVFSAVLFSGCGTGLPTALDERATSFAEGKRDMDYTLEGSRQRLDFLIEHFSGAANEPDIIRGEDGHAAYGNVVVNILYVASDQDLLEAFRNAYEATATQLRFTYANGYSATLDQDRLGDLLRQVRRTDPINSIGIRGWDPNEVDGVQVIDIYYHFSRQELLKIKEQTPVLVKEIVEQLGTSEQSDYQKICAVNRYLCENVVYPDPGPNPKRPYPPQAQIAYYTLKNHSGVCEGYATAAALLLREMGIECDIPYGVLNKPDANGNPIKHAWNLVKLHGQWYQMDVTWNDGASSTEYLLTTDLHMRSSRSWRYSDYEKTPLMRYRGI
jgi:transglutaminase-like putative cysteine protease